MSYKRIFLSQEQTEVIRAAAASIEPCSRERFLASVQDELLCHEPDIARRDREKAFAVAPSPSTMMH